MPLWTDAYIGDTMHLSTIQHGAYLLLLMHAWRSTNCTIPDDDIKLSRITRMHLRDWKRNREIVLEFWDKEEGLVLTQKRLLNEFNQCLRFKERQRQAGLKSSESRKRGQPALNQGSTGVQPARAVLRTPSPSPSPKEEEVLSTFNVPSKDEVANYAESKKKTRSFGIYCWKSWTANNWRHYGQPITSHEQWQCLLETEMGKAYNP